METAAVSFEDQPLVSPEEVRLQGAPFHLERDIYLRLRQANLKANVKEHPLELASAPSVLRMNFIEEPAKTSNSSPTPSSTYLKAKLTVVDDPHGFRLPQGLSQFPWRQDSREVQQRARDGGAGNPVELGAVRTRQPSVPVGDNPGRTSPAPVGRNHVDRVAIRFPEPPEARCGSMG